MSPARERALAVLRKHYGGLNAKAFAAEMWPGSRGHQVRSRRSSTPAGGALGAGIQMTAGAFLWRLQRDGLASAQSTVHHQSIWFITRKGLEAITHVSEPASYTVELT